MVQKPGNNIANKPNSIHHTYSEQGLSSDTAFESQNLLCSELQYTIELAKSYHNNLKTTEGTKAGFLKTVYHASESSIRDGQTGVCST
jgi:hypothetical protein